MFQKFVNAINDINIFFVVTKHFDTNVFFQLNFRNTWLLFGIIDFISFIRLFDIRRVISAYIYQSYLIYWKHAHFSVQFLCSHISHPLTYIESANRNLFY